MNTTSTVTNSWSCSIWPLFPIFKTAKGRIDFDFNSINLLFVVVAAALPKENNKLSAHFSPPFSSLLIAYTFLRANNTTTFLAQTFLFLLFFFRQWAKQIRRSNRKTLQKGRTWQNKRRKKSTRKCFNLFAHPKARFLSCAENTP